MGILDKIKSVVSGRRDQLKSGIDKASGTVESKVGAKHAPKVDKAAEKAKIVVDKLAGEEPSTSPTIGPDDSTTDTPSTPTGTADSMTDTPSPTPAGPDESMPDAPSTTTDPEESITQKDPPVTGV